MTNTAIKISKDLDVDIEVMLKAFRLPYKSYFFSKQLPKFYVVPEFGIIISGVNTSNQAEMSERLSAKFSNYKLIYIYASDKLTNKRYKVLWDLMRGGYLTYLRSNYGSVFLSTLQREDLAQRIIKERLRIWKDKPKYKYFIDINKEALEYPPAVILAREPGFYDMMPEEVEVSDEGAL